MSLLFARGGHVLSRKECVPVAVGLLLLTGYVAALAAGPRWRAQMDWGRGGKKPPPSAAVRWAFSFHLLLFTVVIAAKAADLPGVEHGAGGLLCPSFFAILISAVVSAGGPKSR